MNHLPSPIEKIPDVPWDAIPTVVFQRIVQLVGSGIAPRWGDVVLLRKINKSNATVELVTHPGCGGIGSDEKRWWGVCLYTKEKTVVIYGYWHGQFVDDMSALKRRCVMNHWIKIEEIHPIPSCTKRRYCMWPFPDTRNGDIVIDKCYTQSIPMMACAYTERRKIPTYPTESSLMACIGMCIADPRRISPMSLAVSTIAIDAIDHHYMLGDCMDTNGKYSIPGIGPAIIYLYYPTGDVTTFDTLAPVEVSTKHVVECTVRLSEMRVGPYTMSRPMIIVEVPAYPASGIIAHIACAAGCKGICAHRRCCIQNGKTWLTMQDVGAMMPYIIRRRFEQTVIKVSIQTGASGCSLIHGETTGTLVEKIYQRRNGIKDSWSERIAAAIISTVDITTDRLQKAIGYSVEELIAFGAVCDKNTVMECMQILKSEGIIHKFGEKPTIEVAPKEADLPGMELLEMGGWNVKVLLPALPGCLKKIAEECTTIRHPKFAERMLFGIFLSRIKGLRTGDGRRLYDVWRTLFEHPEAGASSSHRKNPGFDTSKYGLAAIKDITHCADTHSPHSCPFAIKSGLCPYYMVGKKVSVVPTDMIGSCRAMCGVDLVSRCKKISSYIDPAMYYRCAYDVLLIKK